MKSIKPRAAQNVYSQLKTLNLELFNHLDESSQVSFSGGKYISRKPKEIVVVGGQL